MNLLQPLELQKILSQDLDIVDVRDLSEWQSGHLEQARLMPLSQVRANPRQSLPRDGVVLLCARGLRSAQAAEIAETLGYVKVYSLAGGLQAWQQAGLPLIKPAEQAVSEKPAIVAETAAQPELDSVVGANLRQERMRRGWSLDDLARQAGIARTLLGQVELGKATPSISVVWKIAQAIGLPFAALIAHPTPRVGTTVVRRATAKKLTSADGRFTSRALFRPDAPQAPEFYELLLAPHSREDADAHRPGTCENLIVTSGRLLLQIGAESVTLTAGDSVDFSADQPHAYVNESAEPCWMYLVMRYNQA